MDEKQMEQIYQERLEERIMVRAVFSILIIKF